MSEPIEVIVGPEGDTKTWHLPKKLLVNASPFFAAALNGSFSEATSRRVPLPEDDPHGFALFVRWLYVGHISGDILSCESEDDKSDILGDSASTSDYDTVAQMFLQACSLGEKHNCLQFRDCAVGELIHLWATVSIGAEAIPYVFGHFAPGSKIRLLAIDQFRFDLHNGEFKGRKESFLSAAESAVDFALDYLASNMEHDGAPNPQSQKERYMEVLTDTDEN